MFVNLNSATNNFIRNIINDFLRHFFLFKLHRYFLQYTSKISLFSVFLRISVFILPQRHGFHRVSQIFFFLTYLSVFLRFSDYACLSYHRDTDYTEFHRDYFFSVFLRISVSPCLSYHRGTDFIESH